MRGEWSRVFGAASALALAFACSGGSSDKEEPSCETGTERCQCYRDETCDDGLTCLSELCVDIGNATGGRENTNEATGGRTPTGGRTSSGGPSLAGGAPVTAGTGGGDTQTTGGREAATGGSGDSGGSAPTTGGSTNSSNRAPEIVALTQSTAVVDPETHVVVDVRATDPDGVDDIAGAKLVDSKGRAYGTFSTTAIDGAFTLALNFNQINQVEARSADPDGTTETFEVVVTDESGASDSRELSLTLDCDDVDDQICGGACSDPKFDAANCGACGKACGEQFRCSQGLCSVPRQERAYVTCDIVCADIGAVCRTRDIEGIVSAGQVNCLSQPEYSVGLASCAQEPPFSCDDPMVICNDCVEPE